MGVSLQSTTRTMTEAPDSEAPIIDVAGITSKTNMMSATAKICGLIHAQVPTVVRDHHPVEVGPLMRSHKHAKS